MLSVNYEQAEADYNLEKAAELRHGRIPQLEHELKELEDQNKANAEARNVSCKNQ